MKFEALYYPYFEPPKKWLLKSLLVFDTIATIVPEDVSPNYSEDFLKLLELIPESINRISPTPLDKSIPKLNLERIDKAFEIIKDNSPHSQPNEFKIIIPKDGTGIHIAGHSLIHNNKISKEIRYLLKKHNLIKPDATTVIGSFSQENKGFEVVNEMAANIIMSLLADRISKRKGLYSITDLRTCFAVNSLNAFGLEYKHDSEGILTGSILKYEIPKEIEDLSLKQYLEIRDAYADIRTLFCKVVCDLANYYRLESIKDLQALKHKVIEITRDFDRGVNTFKKTNIFNKIKGWDMIAIGSLALITGLICEELPSKLLSLSSSVLVKIVDKLRQTTVQETDLQKVQRLIAGMNHKIIDAAEIRRLA